MDLIKKFLSLLWVNILWLLCCIPVLTAGTSTCAAFAVTLRLADDDEEVQSFRGITRRFFKAFRQDLIQGFLILLFTVITFGLGGFFVYLAWDDGLNLIKIGLLAVYFLVVLVLNFYSYPLIARYSNTFINTLRNSIALFAQYANSSIKALGIVIVELLVLTLTFKVYFAGILILPALIFYTISVPAKNIFVKIENPESTESSESTED
ncbi:YesL family protein [Treponema bryantii]|uniref:YesL family protein n=1 Tax=Treponema bryantii TaxID=163 RepID=UPI002B2BA448|nr:hypothetical protein TRBR_04590 [Treponema bryantii]